jgi:hypothetical protein
MRNDSACKAQFVPLEYDCGYGICNETTSACVCESGYSNFGDFSLNPSGSCDLYTEAIVGEWIACAIITIVSLVFSITVIIRRKKAGILFDRKAWRVGIIPFCQLLNCILSAIMVVLKCIDPSSFAVGHSIATVLLTSGFISVISCSLLTGLIILMKTSMALLPTHSEQLFRLQKNFKSLKHISAFLAGIGLVLIWSPILMLINSSLAYVSANILGIGLGSMMLLIGCFIGSLFISRLITGIEDTIESAQPDRHQTESYLQLKRVLKKLKVTRFFEVFGFFFATIILEVFCFTPYLMRKASYLMPLAFIAGLLAVDILIWSHHNLRSQSQPKTDTSLTDKVSNNNKIGFLRRLTMPTAE